MWSSPLPLATFLISCAALTSTTHATSNRAPTSNHDLVPRQCAGTLCGWNGALCCPADTVCSTNAQNNASCAPRNAPATPTTGSEAVSALSSSSLAAAASVVVGQGSTSREAGSSMSSAVSSMGAGMSSSGSGGVSTMGTGMLSSMPTPTPTPTPASGGGGNLRGWSGVGVVGGVVAVVVM
ncbi:hypothetical protein DE146DRAFT_223811 [Phaeosphaeria sp. MPI-PUGE-AT-0046c]|nr:hypothetical protein DE146DRAFT_223811 [Phaeosphaeria sp. MPI-PUGE-AT-0046c]